MRRTVTIAMVVIGVALMVVGYFSSAPWGASSIGNSNPTFSFAPALFVLGVIVVFSSAVVYELLPRRFDR